MRRRDRGIGHVPNNRAQNRAFRDAARGLTLEQKERLRREIESQKRQYENYDYHRIRQLAEEILRRDNEKIQKQ